MVPRANRALAIIQKDRPRPSRALDHPTAAHQARAKATRYSRRFGLPVESPGNHCRSCEKTGTPVAPNNGTSKRRRKKGRLRPPHNRPRIASPSGSNPTYTVFSTKLFCRSCSPSSSQRR